MESRFQIEESFEMEMRLETLFSISFKGSGQLTGYWDVNPEIFQKVNGFTIYD